jgi:putative FmdB family regulatory protein
MLYKFRCPEHGAFEVSQPMAADHKAACPVCRQPAQRIYGPYNGHFNINKPVYALFDKHGNYEECPDPNYLSRERLEKIHKEKVNARRGN